MAKHQPRIFPREKQILLVDDDKLILFSLRAALENDSLAITTASSGAHALAQAAVLDGCSLCIIDLFLPDMTGVKLIHQLKALQPNARFIVITGKYRNKNDFLEHEKDAATIGPFAFLTKPFDFALAQQVVNEALADNKPM